MRIMNFYFNTLCSWIFILILTVMISSCESDLQETLDKTTIELNDSLYLESGIGTEIYQLDVDSDNSIDIRIELYGTQSHGIPSGYVSVYSFDSTFIAKKSIIDTIWIEGGFNFILDTFKVFEDYELNDTIKIEQAFTDQTIFISKLIGDYSSGGKYTDINNGFEKNHYLVFKKQKADSETYYGWIKIYQENNFKVYFKKFYISNIPQELFLEPIIIIDNI